MIRDNMNNCDCGYKDKYNEIVKEFECMREDIKVLYAAKQELEEQVADSFYKKEMSEFRKMLGE